MDRREEAASVVKLALLALVLLKLAPLAVVAAGPLAVVPLLVAVVGLLWML